MKYRFKNPPADIGLADMLRALADLLDENLLEASLEEDLEIHIGATEFAGCACTMYEPDWIQRLVQHYRDTHVLK